MVGYVHSICSMSTKDGPGIRTVVFMQGCPLRCVYCHNPDTWPQKGGEALTPEALFARIDRFVPYYGKEGGVTFSGGEPLAQPEFLCEALSLAKKRNIHTALDTAGARLDDAVMTAVRKADLIMLDIKFNEEEGYRRYAGGSLATALDFLDFLNREEKPVWIRQVIVPDINDRPEDIGALLRLLTPYLACVRRIELLPFRTLCREKYAALGISFPLEGTPDMDAAELEKLAALLPKAYR